MIPDIQFNGVHLLIVFIAIAVGFVFGCIMGYVIRDEMIRGE